MSGFLIRDMKTMFGFLIQDMLHDPVIGAMSHNSDRRFLFSPLQRALPCPRLQPVGLACLACPSSALQRGFSMRALAIFW
jgi:hypothetical protein